MGPLGMMPAPVCVCRNVPGSSAPAGTQLAIYRRTLRAVLAQPGKQAAVNSHSLGLFLEERPEYC